ncbi:hypothetical protein BpHYR1_001529 [Brachionus plicatilis]|uniref:Uncharacterized protein n=1 Tax=Brachionus plicatilis TaxID=10195 RepID=A0A3M7P2U7_BRAPC|nr:hypothetical protein BpHYR1_001529 [Brachionus plicatilis]
MLKNSQEAGWDHIHLKRLSLPTTKGHTRLNENEKIEERKTKDNRHLDNQALKEYHESTYKFLANSFQ